LIAFGSFGPTVTPEFRALSAERTALLDDLSAAALGVKIELAPGAVARIDRQFAGADRRDIGVRIAFLSKYPRDAFEDRLFLKLVSQGILRSPAVDVAKARRLLDLPSYRYLGTWGDEQVEVHFLSPAQAAACARQRCGSSDSP
jgi:hypothetical protein